MVLPRRGGNPTSGLITDERVSASVIARTKPAMSLWESYCLMRARTWRFLYSCLLKLCSASRRTTVSARAIDRLWCITEFRKGG